MRDLACVLLLCAVPHCAGGGRFRCLGGAQHLKDRFGGG